MSDNGADSILERKPSLRDAVRGTVFAQRNRCKCETTTLSCHPSEPSSFMIRAHLNLDTILKFALICVDDILRS